MGLFERVDGDLAEARRRSDQHSLDALGLLKSEVVKATKEPGFKGSVDDALVVATVRKEVKRRNESAAAYSQAGRTEAAERELALARVLEAYLPAQLSQAELEAELRQLIAELKPEGPGAFGQVMKEASRRFAGRAEGGAVAAAAKRLLG